MHKLFTSRPIASIFTGLIILCIALMLYYVFAGNTAETFDFNVPRRLRIVAAIVLVSTAVGISSLIFQTITNNYILTPSIMGLDSLYVFLQTLVIFFWGGAELTTMSSATQFICTLLLMVMASSAIFYLMFKGIGHSIYYVVLIGIVFGIAFDGMSTFMQVLIDPNEFAVLEGRMFASFNRIHTDLLGLATLIIVSTSVWIIKDFRKYDVLILGRANAITLGVNYKSLVFKSLIAVGILISCSTVLVGPVTFLGILIVSLARVLLPSYRHSILAIGTVLIGIAVLILGMLATSSMNYTVPLSVIINLVGGSFFIYLILKLKRI